LQRAARWKTRVAAAIAALLMAGAPSPFLLAGNDEVDMALVLAVDCSFSVDHNEFALQMRGLGQAFQRAEVKRAIRQGPLQRIAVSVVQWSDEGNQMVVMPWTVVSTDEEAHSVGVNLENTPRLLAEGGTSISSALLYSAALMTSAPKSSRLVIDLSSDGRNNVGPPVNAVRDRLVAQGITINGLAITNEWPTLNVYLEKQVVGGPGNFVVVAQDYGAYADAIFIKLIREITGPGIS
jgi:Protein of unknown function (DUF1194)